MATTNDISIYLFYLFTYLLCSVGSKHGSNGGSSYIHLEHSYFFFLARSRLLWRQIMSNILNIRIKMSPPRHLSNNCGHHKSKWERFADRHGCSLRTAWIMTGLGLSKSLQYFIGVSNSGCFSCSELLVTGSWRGERWEPMVMDGARQRHF